MQISNCVIGRDLGELERPSSGRVSPQVRADQHNCANELVAQIHDRMPLILALGDYMRWLSEEPDPRDLMRLYPAEPMRMWPISNEGQQARE